MEPQHGQGSNSTAAYSQSRRSSAMNSSISADLRSSPLPMTEARDCKHFGIRQYVADMHEKDRNSCLLFASHGAIEQLLTPMAVPQHKYWHCENCLHGNGDVRRLEEIVMFCGHCENGMMSETTPSPTPLNNEMEICQSEERIIVENASASLSIVPANDLPFATDKNECAEVLQMTEIGQETVETGESQEGSVNLGGVEEQSSPKNVEMNLDSPDEEPGNGLPTSSVKQNTLQIKYGKRKVRDLKYDNSRKSKRPKIKRLCLLKDVQREKGNSEKSHCGTEISPNSNSTPDGPSTSASFSVPMRESKKHENVLSFRVPRRKRNSRKKDGNHEMNIVPWREVISRNYHTEMISGKSQGQSSAAGTSSSKPKHNSSTIRGMEPPLRGSMPPRQQKERKSSLTRKRNSMVQVEESQTLAGPKKNQILGEGQVNQKDFETMKNGSDTHAKDGNVHVQAAGDGFPTGKSFDAVLKNVREILARNDAKHCEQRNYSPLPSNKRIPRVQNLDFSQARNEGMESVKTTPTEHLFFSLKSGTEDNQKGRGRLESSYSASNNFNPSISRIGNADLVEKQFFPMPRLKSVPNENSSIMNSTINHVKLFGRVLGQEKSKGPYVPAHNPGRWLEKSSVFPLQREIVGPSFRQGILGSDVGVCTMNKNPADFSSPDAGNGFMINGVDLKVGKGMNYVGFFGF